MATFVRIRRLHRMSLRVGAINITNAQEGTLVDIDDVATRRDLRNKSTRYVFVDRHASPRVSLTATQTEANMAPLDAAASLTATALFGATTGGKEYAWGVNLPKGFPVTNVAVVVSTAAGGASTHMWLTVATYDGSANLTYRAATTDVTSGTVAVGRLVFNPVVSAGVVYVTPTEGMYYFTLTQTAGTSAVALAGVSFASIGMANVLASPVGGLSTAVGPFLAAQGGSVTTAPVVATTNATSNFTAALSYPYCEIS